MDACLTRVTFRIDAVQFAVVRLYLAAGLGGTVTGNENGDNRPCLWRIVPGSGATGIRTPDLYNAIVALYQLSYDPGFFGVQYTVPLERRSTQGR